MTSFCQIISFVYIRRRPCSGHCKKSIITFHCRNKSTDVPLFQRLQNAKRYYKYTTKLSDELVQYHKNFEFDFKYSKNIKQNIIVLDTIESNHCIRVLRKSKGDIVYVTDGKDNLYKGEILGLYGLVGAGRTELAKSIVGIEKIISGNLKLNSKSIKINSAKWMNYTTNISYNSVIHNFSILGLNDLINWIDLPIHYGMEGENHALDLILKPHYLSILHLPDITKELISNKLDKKLDKVSEFMFSEKNNPEYTNQYIKFYKYFQKWGMPKECQTIYDSVCETY